MWPKTHEQAVKCVCWVGLEAGVSQHYMCHGEECSAWERESDEDRKKRKDDITPRGYCALLEARIRVVVD